NLIQLQVASVDKLKIDSAGNTTLGGTLTVLGASMVGGNGGAFQIDTTGTAALQLGTAATTGQVTIGRSGQIQALAGNATIVGTPAGGNGGACQTDTTSTAAPAPGTAAPSTHVTTPRAATT